jgi:hypothetical protein
MVVQIRLRPARRFSSDSHEDNSHKAKDQTLGKQQAQGSSLLREWAIVGFQGQHLPRFNF